MAMFHGRGVSSTERKTRLTRAEREKRRKLVCVVTVLGFVCFYAGALLWAAFDAVGVEHMDRMGEWMIVNPFPFVWIDDEALLGSVCWGAVAFLIPWIFYSMWVRRQGNYDPGAEHGDSRLATPEDFEDIADRDLPSNNIKFTTNAWMVVKLSIAKARKALSAAMSALNLNVLVIGTSGGGKTSSYVKTLLASSLGTRLCPGGVNAAGLADPGFDVVFTDTKGDVLPDVGHAFVNSGADVRCFNIRDPENSDRMNPYHYIPVSFVDVIEPSGKPIAITMTVDGAPALLDEATGSEELRIAVDGRQVLVGGVGRPGNAADAWVCPSCGKLNPCDAETCASEGCGGERSGNERPIVAFFGATSFAVGGSAGCGMKIRIRNRAEAGMAPIQVRIEAKLPHGFWLTSAHTPGEDEKVGELLLSPDGEPVFRWDVRLDAGMALAADIEALVVKERKISGSMLTRTCSCVVSNLNATDADGGKEDPFWPRCATMLFQGVSGLQLEVWGKKACTLPSVMDFILDMQVDPQDSAKDSVDLVMEAWETGFRPAPTASGAFHRAASTMVPVDVRDMSPIEVLPDGYWKPKPDQRWFGPHSRSEDPALSAYYAYRKGAPETRQSVLITSASTLSAIMSPIMRKLLSEDTLHLEKLGSEDGAHVLSIISHDMDKTFKPLIALVFYLTLLQLDENATSRPGARLPRHVHILADEFKNLGKLPEIDGALATVRSKNVSVSMCVQSVDQLDAVYGEHTAAELRDNCATVVFMGGSNEKTLKSFETLSGTETVDMIQTSRSFGTSGQTTESRQAVQRPVVSVGQLRTCPPTHAYVLMKGKPAFKDWKTGYGAYDFYEWFDPTREERGCSHGKRKFTEYFDFARYKADRDAGRTPYDYDESLKSQPAAWTPQGVDRKGRRKED